MQGLSEEPHVGGWIRRNCQKPPCCARQIEEAAEGSELPVSQEGKGADRVGSHGELWALRVL